MFLLISKFGLFLSSIKILYFSLFKKLSIISASSEISFSSSSSFESFSIPILLGFLIFFSFNFLFIIKLPKVKEYLINISKSFFINSLLFLLVNK